MSTITRLVAGVRDPSRVNVYLDGKFTFSLSADEVTSRGLAVGIKLDEKGLATLEDKSTVEKLTSKILNFLSYRPRSQTEVVRRLQHYKATLEQVTAVLDFLRPLGYLDDESFAEYLVDSRRSQGRSTRHIQSELSRLGIDKDTISSILTDPTADRQSLQELIEKKSHLPREKLISYLARRGFSWELVKQALVEYN